LPAAIVLLAAVVRLVWLLLVDPEVGLLDDAGYYHFFAQGIAEGRGYVRPEGTPTAFWPVGYPAALAAIYAVVGPSLLAAKLFNLLLAAGTTALLYALARVWFTRPQAGLAAAIYALWPGAIVYTSVTMSESLFTFLFVASLLLLAIAPSMQARRGATAVAFGALVAAANYVRGQALLLPLLALPWLTRQGWQARRVLIFTGAALVVVAALSMPWLVRNSLRFEELSFLSTNAGMNFWLGHREGANGGPDYHDQLAFAQRFDYLPRLKQEPAWSREGLREGLDYVLAHPWEEPRLSVLKVYQLYRADADGLLWNEQNGATPIFSDTTRDRLRLLCDAYYYAFGLLALAGLAMGLRRRAGWAVFCGLTLAYWTLVHVVFYGEPRLHAPVVPLLALLASVAIWQAGNLARERKERRISATI
jgi:4-amino-4-deoxy-L-arabinose transferase-like glycosyltransferase